MTIDFVTCLSSHLDLRQDKINIVELAYLLTYLLLSVVVVPHPFLCGEVNQ